MNTIFETIINNISDQIALININGIILYASPSVKKILGYQISDFIGKNITEFIHTNDINNFNELITEILKEDGKLLSNRQLRIKNSINNWMWHEFTSQNLLNDPSINAIVLNFRDISDRKRAEKEIILQKSYFQQLFENSPEGIVILDNQERILNSNKGFEKMFQFNFEEIKGKKLNELIVPESMIEQATQMTLFVLKGQIIHRETERKRKDGSTIDVSMLSYPITYGEKQLGVYCIYSDITERKETERALMNSEERYRAFVKQNTVGIFRYEFLEPISIKLPIDEQVNNVFRFGYLAECNDVFAKMYGYNSANEIAGARIGEILLETNPRSKDYIKKCILGDYKIDNIESCEIDKNGYKVYFLNNLVGIVDLDYLNRIWGTQRDITENKKTEEQLKKLAEELAANAKISSLDSEYHLALSFSGDDRKYVEAVAENLTRQNVKVFYDKFETANLWGKDLSVYFQDIYKNKSKNCIIFISKSYKDKMWTNLERRSALERAIIEKDKEYILPARFDDTELPGISSNISFIDLRSITANKFTEIIIDKLKKNGII